MLGRLTSEISDCTQTPGRGILSEMGIFTNHRPLEHYTHFGYADYATRVRSALLWSWRLLSVHTEECPLICESIEGFTQQSQDQATRILPADHWCRVHRCRVVAPVQICSLIEAIRR
jgi:hypothetical protein